VRDEQVGEAERVAQISQKIDDGRLYRHIERRHRLVADDEARPCRKRAGNRDALALATAELERIAPTAS
jgi:hypothetical protein